MDLINQINLGNDFMRSIEPINRLIQTHPSYCNITMLWQGRVFFLVEFRAWTLRAEVVLIIRHLLDCCILGEASQRMFALVIKISQSRA